MSESVLVFAIIGLAGAYVVYRFLGKGRKNGCGCGSSCCDKGVQSASCPEREGGRKVPRSGKSL